MWLRSWVMQTHWPHCCTRDTGKDSCTVIKNVIVVFVLFEKGKSSNLREPNGLFGQFRKRAFASLATYHIHLIANHCVVSLSVQWKDPVGPKHWKHLIHAGKGLELCAQSSVCLRLVYCRIFVFVLSLLPAQSLSIIFEFWMSASPEAHVLPFLKWLLVTVGVKGHKLSQ